MDAERFDAIARSLSSRLSRRVALRGATASTLAGLFAFVRGSQAGSALGQAATPTPLPVCTDPDRPGVGCACTSGEEDACGGGTLICCKDHPDGPPGSPGTCTPSSVGCNPLGPPTECTGRSCRCDSGTENACESGLICCSDNPGLPGGPGRCVDAVHCHTGDDCQGQGCTCHSGTRDACYRGLVCCAHDSSMPGGTGRCEEENVCFAHQCQSTTNPCPSDCAASTFCKTCCSGYCGAKGHCATPTCEGIGCPCTAGVEGSCSEGLVCCQSQMTAPNTPGGPGMCAAPDACGGGDGSPVAGTATPGT